MVARGNRMADGTMERYFDNREAASAAAAEALTGCLARRLQLQGDASLVVSGGTSPVRTFELLSGAELDWRSVHVILSDERWVAPNDDDSNERQVREKLLVGDAARARFLPLYAAGVDPAARCGQLQQAITEMPFPFTVSLLGMGNDGHFASLFPDAPNLEERLDPDSDQLCVPVQTEASVHLRLSLTLAALSRSDEIALLIFGEDKLAVYEDAKTNKDRYPVSRLLYQKRAPVRVFWAP